MFPLYNVKVTIDQTPEHSCQARTRFRCETGDKCGAGRDRVLISHLLEVRWWCSLAHEVEDHL